MVPPDWSQAVLTGRLVDFGERLTIQFHTGSPRVLAPNGRKPVQRRLAAILAADVVGYSRLMGAYEVGTHIALKSHRVELIDPKIAEHQGRIVKLTGDGMLVEFPSVVNAVDCATKIQRE